MSQNLFVLEEDGDMIMDDAISENNDNTYESDEDPVVMEIPINLTRGPCPLHVLQYANKSKKLGKSLNSHPHISEFRYGDRTGLMEMDIPLNTQVFFDEIRSKEDWNDVKVQTLRGVGVPNEGQYVGIMFENQLYLLPIEKVSQMRPFFKYIDSTQLQKKQDDAMSQSQINAPKKAQVVTMSVKSSSEATQTRLGGSLLAHKIANEEDVIKLKWKEDTYEDFLNVITKPESRQQLEPIEDSCEYLNNLV